MVRKGTMGAVLLASTLLAPLGATACEHAARATPAPAQASQVASHEAHGRHFMTVLGMA